MKEQNYLKENFFFFFSRAMEKSNVSFGNTFWRVSSKKYSNYTYYIKSNVDIKQKIQSQVWQFQYVCNHFRLPTI